MSIESFLATVEPFKTLGPDQRRRLSQSATERSYAKGELVFRSGQPSDAVWVVRTGRVHLMECLADGKASTTCVMTPGEVFCCLPALDRKQYPADAVASEDTSVVRISAETFHQALAGSPNFLSKTLGVFCSRLRQVEHKSCMIYESAEARLAEVLLTLSEKFGPTIPLTRQELAEIAGVTHETAIRTLSRFGKQGLIRSVRGKTTILAAEKLKKLLTD
jgi:CRP-like cAMP-binding protein